MKAIPQNSEGSVSRGLWFVCEDGTNTIKIWGSSFSGKEEVYLNDQLVSEKRNISTNSEHNFEDASGNQYQAKMEVLSMMKGTLECHIYKNGNLLKKYRSGYEFGQILKPKNLAILLVSAVVVGVLASVLNLPEWGILLSIAVLVTVVFFLSSRRAAFSIAEVEI